MKRINSYLLPAFLFLGVALSGYYKIYTMPQNVCKNEVIIIITIIGIYLLWLLYEIKVCHNDTNTNIIIADYYTRELYGLSHALTILSALWFSPNSANVEKIQLLGFLIFLGGIFFRIWAIQTLGTYYSHIVRKTNNHQIITIGPYKYIRHPAYGGMIIAHMGIALVFNNYITMSIFILVFIPSIMVRILVEEKTLHTIKDYDAYGKITKKLIPGIW